MKFILLLLISLNLFSCASHRVDSVSQNEINLPPELENANDLRGLASDEQDFVSTFDSTFDSTYEKYFLIDSYVPRLLKLKMLAHQLHINMQDKGHPRKRILEKFILDLNKQIKMIQTLEAEQPSTLLSWLPDSKNPRFAEKITALQNIKFSAYVMGQLESYLTATKVLEDDNYYYQTGHYVLMRKAVEGLTKDLATLPVVPDGVKKAQFSYSSFLSSVARNHLHKVFDRKQRKEQRRVDSFLRAVQIVNDSSEAQSLLNSGEMTYARSFLGHKDYMGSSEIDGYRDDVDTKIATYFGLEMIRYLYSQLN